MGLVQVPPETHADVTPPTLDADVESECPEPSLNVVEVTVAFQPEPLPRASVIESGSV